MTRILTTLTMVNLLSLFAVFAVGVLSWSKGALQDPTDSSTYLIHFGLGLFTIIFNLGLHCIIFIYFLGTGRWVKEVALAYKLPDEPWPKLTRELKRSTFPAALFAMLVPIATAASGMANQHQPGQGFAWLHFGLAVGSILINIWAFRVERRNVETNADIITQVMNEVERIREERGLPSSEEALKAEQ